MYASTRRSSAATRAGMSDLDAAGPGPPADADADADAVFLSFSRRSLAAWILSVETFCLNCVWAGGSSVALSPSVRVSSQPANGRETGGGERGATAAGRGLGVRLVGRRSRGDVKTCEELRRGGGRRGGICPTYKEGIASLENKMLERNILRRKQQRV